MIFTRPPRPGRIFFLDEVNLQCQQICVSKFNLSLQIKTGLSEPVPIMQKNLERSITHKVRGRGGGGGGNGAEMFEAYKGIRYCNLCETQKSA